MKYILIAAFLFQLSVCAQQNKKDNLVALEKRFQIFDNALVEKDTLTLRSLLHKNLTLGHSNAWMETKPDLLQTLDNKGVVYEIIKQLAYRKYFINQKI